MSVVRNVIGAVITVAIGGTVYTVSQADVTNNLAEDTGMSQQQAKEYVEGVNEDELVPYDELGNDYVKDAQFIADTANGIDCVQYEYDWESSSLTCEGGKAQLRSVGVHEAELGEAYIKLGSESAGRAEMTETIRLIDIVNADLKLPIISALLDDKTITDSVNSNSYNKALIKAVLDSDQAK